MAKLRPGRCYRDPGIPYTRKSKYKSRNYTKMSQNSKITQFSSGNLSRSFSRKVILLSKNRVQIRDNALEAARIIGNKFLTDTITDQNFRLSVNVYPHQVLREHALATGAGADRFSSGMQQSFGKPVGMAARLDVGSKIFEIHTEPDNIPQAKIAVQKMSKKLGIKTKAVIV